MIAIDNCIISSLSKINRLALLKQLKGCCTSPGVIEEAMGSGIDVIIESVSAALSDYLEVKSIAEPQKIPKIQDEHPGLSYIDCEIILLCLENRCSMMTDDTELITIAEAEFNILTYDLCDFILTLKNKEILDSNEITQIIRRMEKKDRYKFSSNDLRLLGQ